MNRAREYKGNLKPGAEKNSKKNSKIDQGQRGNIKLHNCAGDLVDSVSGVF